MAAKDKDKLAEEQLKKYDSLKSEYDTKFRDDHQTISQYFLPQSSDISVTKTEGISGWTQNIYDTTAIKAAEVLRSGQYNWLTPPNQGWAEYDVPEELKAKKGDQDEGQLDEAVKWLGKCSDIAMRELARCNFYPMASLGYLGCGVFGTDLMLAEEGKGNGKNLNFRHVKIGTYVVEENDEGIVDTVRREIEMTYRQILQFFKLPSDEIPEKMANQCRTDKGKKFKIIHCIFPREDSDRLPNRKDGPNKPIASVWISLDFRQTMRVSGYEDSPIMCSRFDKWGTGAPWGYSPAYLVLPEARQVNYVQMYLDALAELHAYPRILTPDNLEGDVDLRAGGNTTYDSGNPEAKPQEWATVGDYKMGMEMQVQRREAINDAFFVPAFKLLNSKPLLDKKMTAYEISQRQAEMLSDFTPSFGRRIVEFLTPLMMRVFGILYRAGKFGDAPDSLMQNLGNGKRALVMPQIVITSRISDALKALKNRGTEETFQFILPIAENKPELLDVFEMDDVVREYALNSGMSPDLLRSKKDMGKLRMARAQKIQQAQAAQAAESLGKAGAGLGKSPKFVQDAAQSAMEQGQQAA